MAQLDGKNKIVKIHVSLFSATSHRLGDLYLHYFTLKNKYYTMVTDCNSCNDAIRWQLSKYIKLILNIVIFDKNKIRPVRANVTQGHTETSKAMSIRE